MFTLVSAQLINMIKVITAADVCVMSVTPSYYLDMTELTSYLEAHRDVAAEYPSFFFRDAPKEQSFFLFSLLWRRAEVLTDN